VTGVIEAASGIALLATLWGHLRSDAAHPTMLGAIVTNAFSVHGSPVMPRCSFSERPPSHGPSPSAWNLLTSTSPSEGPSYDR
jgi:hypothetical protein